MTWGSVDRVTTDHIAPGGCLRLLATGQMGRLAFVDADGPAVAHVAYRVVHDAVILRSASPPVLAAARGRQRVAFEVDDDLAGRGGTWTVHVQGVLSEVAAPAERAQLRGVWFPPDPDEQHAGYLLLTAGAMAGERRGADPAPATLVRDGEPALRSRIPPG